MSNCKTISVCNQKGGVGKTTTTVNLGVGLALKEMGYAYNLSPSRKYWTVTPKGYDKPIRLKNLGADYTNDRIVERIKENRDRWAEIEPFQRATYKPRQYRMQTRGQKLKKKGGLYAMEWVSGFISQQERIIADERNTVLPNGAMSEPLIKSTDKSHYQKIS